MSYQFSVRYKGHTVQGCLILGNHGTEAELRRDLNEVLGELDHSDWAATLYGDTYEFAEEQGYAGGLELTLQGSTELSADAWHDSFLPFAEEFERRMNHLQGVEAFGKFNRWPVEHWEPSGRFGLSRRESARLA